MANSWLIIYLLISCSQIVQSNFNVSQFFNNVQAEFIAIEGTNITLPCVITNGKNAVWIRDGRNLPRTVDNLKNIHYEVNSNSSGDFSLRIYNVSRNDIGVYECLSYETGQPTSEPTSAKLIVLDVTSLKPPQLGDDFLRYISMLNVKLACHSSFNPKEFPNLREQQAAIRKWMIATNNLQLNELLYDLSDLDFTCSISDPALQNLPPIMLHFKITSHKGLTIKSSIGSKDFEKLICVENGQNSKFSYTCFNSETIYDESKSPQLRVECEFKHENVLLCTAKGEEFSYTFFVCVSADNVCKFDSANQNLDLFVSTKPSNADPDMIVWKKNEQLLTSGFQLATIKDQRMCCNADRKQILLQLTIDNVNPNVTLEITVPIDRRAVDSTIFIGVFQATCFYWIWKDKVITIFHEGIFVQNPCKIFTLRLKATVCDRNMVDTSSAKCVFLNKPRTPYLLQQLSQIPNIYPIAGVICLSCISILTMVYIGRRLLALYDRVGKSNARNQIERLAQMVPVQAQKKSYSRFLNEDDRVDNKVTLI